MRKKKRRFADTPHLSFLRNATFPSRGRLFEKKEGDF